MDDAALAAQAVEVNVFVRNSPEAKLRLVKALQSHGLPVAMTGDGVNDAPTLMRKLTWHPVLVSALFVVAVFEVFSFALREGHSLAQAHTLAMNTLVVPEIFHQFFIRSIHGTSLNWAAV